MENNLAQPTAGNSIPTTTQLNDNNLPSWDQNDNSVWDRENAFINDNIFFRQGGGFELKGAWQNVGVSGKNPIKILMFGDSFTWGNGATNPAMVIAQRFQDELNARTKPNTFVVVPFAKNGQSLYNFVDVLDENIINKINPDIIIYNYTFNDAIPNFNEGYICGQTPLADCLKRSPKLNPDYQSCLRGESGIIGKSFQFITQKRFPLLSNKLLTRACAPLYAELEKSEFNELSYTNYPLTNPYLPKFYQGLELLEKRFNKKIYISNMVFTLPQDPMEGERFFTTLEKRGFLTIPMTLSLAKRKESLTSDAVLQSMLINPKNGHASSLLTQLYARDIADFLLPKIDTKLLAQAQAGASALEFSNNLIASTLPYHANFTNHPTYSSFTYRDLSESEQYEQSFGKGTSSKDNFQNVACANLGYANVLINFNQNLPAGTQLEVKLIKGSGLSTGLLYYDKNYQEQYLDLGPLTPLTKITIPLDSHGTTFIVADKKAAVGCSLAKPVNMNEFQLDFKLL